MITKVDLFAQRIIFQVLVEPFVLAGDKIQSKHQSKHSQISLANSLLYELAYSKKASKVAAFSVFSFNAFGEFCISKRRFLNVVCFS